MAPFTHSLIHSFIHSLTLQTAQSSCFRANGPKALSSAGHARPSYSLCFAHMFSNLPNSREDVIIPTPFYRHRY